MKYLLAFLFALSPLAHAETPASVPFKGAEVSALPTKILRMGKAKPFEFSVSITKQERVTSPGGSGSITQGDRLFAVQWEADYVSDYAVSVTKSGLNRVDDTPVITDTANKLFAPDADGVMTYKANGTANIIVSFPELNLSSSHTVPVAEVLGANVVTFSGYEEGSLAKHVRDSVAAAVTAAGGVESSSTSLFSVEQYTPTLNLQYNAGAWASHVADLSPYSPYNTKSGKYRAGVLVSPRHVVFVAHWLLDIGTEVYFINRDGHLVHRKLIARKILYVWPEALDIAVGLLETPFTEEDNIGIAKFLPSDWRNYLPTSILYLTDQQIIDHELPDWGYPNIPMLCINQDKKAGIMSFFSQYPTGVGTIPMTEYPRFSWLVRQGDSGQPCFMPVNGELVLMGIWRGGTSGPWIAKPPFVNNSPAGPFLSSVLARQRIDEGMDELSGSDEFDTTSIDLTMFNEYAPIENPATPAP